jgi:hypothetical protein
MQFQGHCDCSRVCFEVFGAPLFTQYCHCTRCRALAQNAQNPLDALGYSFTAAYFTKDFSITAGEPTLTMIDRPYSHLYLCSQCRTVIYGISNDLSQQEAVGINANNFHLSAPLPPEFRPARHIWYENRIVDVDDALPKYKDTPKDQGGSSLLME